MANEDWKLQVSIRTSSNRDSDMINIRANSAEELSILLEGIGDYSTQIAAVAKKVQGAYTVLPLSTQSSTTDTPPWATSPTTQPAAPYATAPTATPPQSSAPTCIHGPRKHLSGVSKKNGKPYSMWVCSQPQGADQCAPAN
jgi:hypothetical protein